MTRRLSQKQETFCLKYFELGNATEAARLAGYAIRSARITASVLLTKPNIVNRVGQLRQKAEDESIAGVVERKQRLTQIARAIIPDYATPEGIVVTKDSPNVGAVSEVTTKTTYSRGNPAVITNVKLHSPIHAIAEINKMEKVYDTAPNINIQQNTINVQVVSDNAKKLTEEILSGEGTD